MTRPKLNIDWKKVDHMLEAHCSCAEIASHLGIHPDTLRNRVTEEYNIGYSEYFRQKKEKGKSSLKVVQYQQALKGNNQMMIWLGKNWLGQKDEPKEEKEMDAPVAQALIRLLGVKSPEEFKANAPSEEK